MAAISLVISILALLFTLSAFWWLHARRGQIVAGQPFTWAGYSQPDGDARLRFPVALANSGPVGIIVTDLRATVRANDFEARLPWSTTRRSLRASADDVEDFAAPFVVNGRDVARLFVEFGGHGADPAALAPGATYTVVVEALTSWATSRTGEASWNELFTTTIEAPPNETRGSYITYTTADR